MSYRRAIIILSFVLLFYPKLINAASEKDIYEQRLQLYKKTEAVTNIPWYFLAAVDQYERNTLTDTSDEPLISITIPKHIWYGTGNVSYIEDERIISFFNGLGKDGNGDGKATITNEEDILYTFAHYLLSYGPSREDIKIALFHFYKRDLTVKTIMNTARIFKKFHTTYLPERTFPVSTDHNYSYRSTWGDRRGFGGLRMHEGTDIFANYGTPIFSTTYGVVELKGWNRFGGWRIGIRDINNIYHYYAHLNSYADNIEVGDIVSPGDLLGFVGSSGYGPPGTMGKFPPHLHYGMYKDNGKSEWSFDPYPYLKRWESMTK